MRTLDTHNVTLSTPLQKCIIILAYLSVHVMSDDSQTDRQNSRQTSFSLKFLLYRENRPTRNKRFKMRVVLKTSN